MKWIPPWSLTERARWAKDHPWVAACCFGVLMFLFVAFVLPPLLGTTASLRFRVGLALAIVPVGAVGLTFALRSGWGVRHGFAPADPTSVRRPLSLVSDRALTALAWICPASILFIGLDLIVGPPRRLIDFFSLGFWVGWFALVTVERRRRRRDRREDPPLPPPSDR